MKRGIVFAVFLLSPCAAILIDSEDDEVVATDKVVNSAGKQQPPKGNLVQNRPGGDLLSKATAEATKSFSTADKALSDFAATEKGAEALAGDHGKLHEELVQGQLELSGVEASHGTAASEKTGLRQHLNSFLDKALPQVPWHYPLMCLVLLGLHAHVYKRDSPSLGIAAAYVLYVLLHTSSSCLQVLVGKSSENAMVKAQAIVFAALTVKLTMSGVLLAVETYRAGTSAEQFSELMLGAFRCTWFPSLLYTTSDMLLLFCQQNMTLTEVQVIAKLGIPITAVIWAVIFKSTIGAQKIVGLLVIMVGTTIYAMGEQTAMGSAPHSAQPVLPAIFGHHPPAVWFFRVVLVLQVLLGTCGGVSNEYFLLRCPASVNMQNCGMYIFGLFLVCTYSRISDEPLPVYSMLRFKPLDWALAFTLGSTGIVTSHFLKQLGSVWKQVAYGAMLVLFFAVDNVVFHKAYPSMAILGVTIVCFGNSACVLDGVKEDTRLKDQESAVPAEHDTAEVGKAK